MVLTRSVGWACNGKGWKGMFETAGVNLKSSDCFRFRVREWAGTSAWVGTVASRSVRRRMKGTELIPDPHHPTNRGLPSSSYKNPEA